MIWYKVWYIFYLIIDRDYTQADDVDDEGDDDGEEIEDDDEDEEYDEEYLDDDDDDEDATSLMKTYGSGSTGNSGQTNRTRKWYYFKNDVVFCLRNFWHEIKISIS